MMLMEDLKKVDRITLFLRFALANIPKGNALCLCRFGNLNGTSCLGSEIFTRENLLNMTASSVK